MTMSKEQEAMQQRTAPAQQAQPTQPQQPAMSQPSYQQSYPANNGHLMYQGSSLQPGHTYNTVMPGGCAVPGPIMNPAFQHPTATPGYELLGKKSIIEAYLVWLIFGLVGGHHFYLRRYGFGVLYFLTFGLCGVGFVIDLFRMPYLVSMANKRRMDMSLERKKNISDAYTLWFPMGLFGFHHFYLGNYGFGTFYLFTVGGFGIGWLIDLVRIPYMVRDYNNMSKLELDTKSVGTAYVLAVTPAGLFGAHHFYLRRPLWGLLYFLTFGILGIGWLVDWFRVPILVKRVNKEIITSQKDEKKYLDDAYLLWFPLGLTGLHNVYLERFGWALFYFLTFGGLGLGWLIDGCRMHCLVKEANKRKEARRLLPHGYIPATGYTIAAPYTSGPPGQPIYYPRQHEVPQPPQTQPVNPPAYQQSAPANAPAYPDQPPPYTK